MKWKGQRAGPAKLRGWATTARSRCSGLEAVWTGELTLAEHARPAATPPRRGRVLPAPPYRLPRNWRDSVPNDSPTLWTRSDAYPDTLTALLVLPPALSS